MIKEYCRCRRLLDSSRMHYILWPISVVCGLFWLLCALINFGVFITWFMPNTRSPSMVLLFGGVAGLVSLACAPLAELSTRMRHAWVPLLLDVGCVPILLIWMGMGLSAAWRKSRHSG